MKKKNKVLKIVLIVLGALVALLAAAVLGVLFYLHSMAAGIPETLPDAPADSTQFTLTDDEIDKLLSGEITLEELTGEAAASSGGGNRRRRPVLRSRRKQVLPLPRGALAPRRRAAMRPLPARRRTLPAHPAPALLLPQKNRRPLPVNRKLPTRRRSRRC